jgi:hypothetical protein
MSDLWSTDEQLVGRWDPAARLFIVTGWTYGPAGPARVDVAPGLTFGVDFANPTVTCEISMEAPLSGDHTALDPKTEAAALALLGPRTLDRVLRLADPDRRRHTARIASSQLRDPKGGLRTEALGRFALLAETATNRDVDPLTAALAGLEAAAVASIADPSLSVLRTAAATLVSGATDLLRYAVERDNVEVNDLRFEQEVSTLVRRALRAVDNDVAARRLQRFIRDLERGAFRARPPVAALASFPFPKTDAAQPPRPPVGRDLMLDAPAGATATRTGDTEIAVIAPNHGDGLWARVFRRDDRLLLALAPLHGRGRASRALLVIPHGFQAAELLVDITDEPDAARPSDTLVALRSAIATGRHACRLERIGDEAAAQ